jgi:hypothetical protein
MPNDPRRLVIVVRPARDGRRLREVLRWIRSMVPAAVLLVAPAAPPTDLPDDARVIQVDADGVDGPLAVASRLAGGR